MLTAYYDFANSPASYDFVAFLLEAERYRLQTRARAMTINFLPGPFGGFRRDRFWPPTVAERQAMFDRVVLPMARMLPSVAEIVVSRVRPERFAHWSIGHQGSLYGLRVQAEAMRAGIRPLRSLRPRSPGRELVTITLREAAHWPERNSNVDAWLGAAVAIERRGFPVMVIRDTLRADEPLALLAGIRTCPEASRNLDVRANLYTAARANLFVNNGPAWFAMALDAPVLMLKPTVEGLMPTCSVDYFRSCGIGADGMLPGVPPHQRIEWAEDTEENIVRAFAAYMTQSTAEQKEQIT